MPLIHSSSDSAFKQNLHTLFHEVGKSPHVKSRDQALAIAYAVKRRGRAPGGAVAGAPMVSLNGGAPMAPVNSALPNFNMTGMGNGVGGGAMPSPQPGAMPTLAPSPVNNSGARPMTGTVTPPPGSWRPPSFGGGAMPLPAAMPSMPANGPAVPRGTVTGANARAPSSFFSNPALAAAYRARPGFAFGGSPAPWQLRSEARNMMHSGPIMSAVPGRTDRHNMSLAAGSYVVPAHVISHLGQSNTMAGMNVASQMFGKTGPYGSGATMGIPHGAGAPKPPRPFNYKFAGGGAPYDNGGGRGDDSGQPIDVVTAGGEYVIEPDIVRNIGGGSIPHGHDVLDAWVRGIQKEHARAIKNLPGPAKD